MNSNRPKAERKKTTYSISVSLHRQLIEAVTRDGGGLRGKSRWVSQAIEAMLDSDENLIEVGIGDDLEKKEKIDVLSLPLEIKERVDQAVFTIRRRDPMMEGPQGLVIRSAIRFRLRNGISPGEE